MAEGLTVAPAAATGIGSLPGVHTREWSITLAGELPDLPHVPELPGRGPGADMIGRTAGLLAAVAPDLAVATTPSGWRFTSSPGREMARAQSWLGEDLDGIEEALAGRAEILKAQLVGPWTLAAMIEMRTGERAVRDHGACRDLAGALAEASVRHIADLRRRLPGARIILQFDEPALPTVLAGGVSTASGMATYRSVDVQRAQLLLGQVFSAAHDAGAVPGVHCCDARAPIDLLRRSGAEMLSVDPAVLAEDQEESLGAAVEAGLLVLLGYAPTVPVTVSGPQALGEVIAGRAREQYARWGIPADVANAAVAFTPACGLADTSPEWARWTYAGLGIAGRIARDEAAPEGEEV
ncbi:MAG: hypothetical protein NWR17_01440 [Candidatus Nanopelagicales bacterium]|jgi:hypothetical protein|nr:hypothetical protein [Candidatus Nanopelagicales bacterium]